LVTVHTFTYTHYVYTVGYTLPRYVTIYGLLRSHLHGYRSTRLRCRYVTAHTFVTFRFTPGYTFTRYHVCTRVYVLRTRLHVCLRLLLVDSPLPTRCRFTRFTRLLHVGLRLRSGYVTAVTAHVLFTLRLFCCYHTAPHVCPVTFPFTFYAITYGWLFTVVWLICYGLRLRTRCLRLQLPHTPHTLYVLFCGYVTGYVTHLRFYLGSPHTLRSAFTLVAGCGYVCVYALRLHLHTGYVVTGYLHTFTVTLRFIYHTRVVYTTFYTHVAFRFTLVLFTFGSDFTHTVGLVAVYIAHRCTRFTVRLHTFVYAFPRLPVIYVYVPVAGYVCLFYSVLRCYVRYRLVYVPVTRLVTFICCCSYTVDCHTFTRLRLHLLVLRVAITHRTTFTFGYTYTFCYGWFTLVTLRCHVYVLDYTRLHGFLRLHIVTPTFHVWLPDFTLFRLRLLRSLRLRRCLRLLHTFTVTRYVLRLRVCLVVVVVVVGLRLRRLICGCYPFYVTFVWLVVVDYVTFTLHTHLRYVGFTFTFTLRLRLRLIYVVHRYQFYVTLLVYVVTFCCSFTHTVTLHTLLRYVPVYGYYGCTFTRLLFYTFVVTRLRYTRLGYVVVVYHVLFTFAFTLHVTFTILRC